MDHVYHQNNCFQCYTFTKAHKTLQGQKKINPIRKKKFKQAIISTYNFTYKPYQSGARKFENSKPALKLIMTQDQIKISSSQASGYFKQFMYTQFY